MQRARARVYVTRSKNSIARQVAASGMGMTRAALIGLLLVARTACLAMAFPFSSHANGTVLVESAFGGDVVLAPDAGGELIVLA